MVVLVAEVMKASREKRQEAMVLFACLVLNLALFVMGFALVVIASQGKVAALCLLLLSRNGPPIQYLVVEDLRIHSLEVGLRKVRFHIQAASNV